MLHLSVAASPSRSRPAPASPPRSLPASVTAWPMILMVLSVLSMVFGNLAALAQSSVRRLLAYSAIAHAGYILLGLAFFGWVERERAGHPLLHRHLRPHHHRRIRRGRRRRARHRLRQASTPSSACTSAIRCSPPCCSCSSSRSPEFRRWSASGPSSICLPRCSRWGRDRLLRRGRYPRCHRSSALVALAIAFSAVSLYYYLQVLKRAYVMPAVDESPIHAHPVTLAVLLAIAAAVVVLGLLPGAAAELDRQLLSGDVNRNADSRATQRAARPAGAPADPPMSSSVESRACPPHRT